MAASAETPVEQEFEGAAATEAEAVAGAAGKAFEEPPQGQEQESASMAIDGNQVVAQPSDASAAVGEEEAAEEHESADARPAEAGTAAQDDLAEKEPGDAPPAQAPQAPPARQSRGDLKRKRDLAPLTKKAERLARDEQQAEQGVTEKRALVEAKAAELRRLEEDLRKQQEIAAAARRAATKAEQEVATHDLPPVPEKPSNPWIRFQQQVLPTVIAEPGKKPLQKLAEMWQNVSKEEKQKYVDAYDADMKEYKAWERSEEGIAILARRSEIIQAQKRGVGGGISVSAAQPGSEERDTQASPAKRAKPSEPMPTPVKQRSVAKPPVNTPAAAAPAIEESILEEADKLSMRGQLLNLAGRPEVQAMKKSSQDLLNALKASSGMVNAAKRILTEPE